MSGIQLKITAKKQENRVHNERKKVSQLKLSKDVKVIELVDKGIIIVIIIFII